MISSFLIGGVLGFLLTMLYVINRDVKENNELKLVNLKLLRDIKELKQDEEATSVTNHILCQKLRYFRNSNLREVTKDEKGWCVCANSCGDCWHRKDMHCTCDVMPKVTMEGECLNWLEDD